MIQSMIASFYLGGVAKLLPSESESVQVREKHRRVKILHHTFNFLTLNSISNGWMDTDTRQHCTQFNIDIFGYRTNLYLTHFCKHTFLLIARKASKGENTAGKNTLYGIGITEVSECKLIYQKY